MRDLFKIARPRPVEEPTVHLQDLSADTLRQLLSAVRTYRASRADAPPLAITCRGRVDGAGAQALGILSAFLWAGATGCRYLHTPFATMDHARGSQTEWAAQWEPFFNLGRDEARVPKNAVVMPAEAFIRDPDACVKAGAVLAARSFHWSAFQTPKALHRLRRRLRTKYHAAAKCGLALHRGPVGALTVAVHVRRGDVTADHPRRGHFYTHDAPILNTIASVRAVAATMGRAVHVNLFSEGPPDMFNAFAAAGCRLHLDGDPFEAFHNMVSADILVQAKSSFSYVAGLISAGAVLHERYVGRSGTPFYRPAPGWIVRDGSGALAVDELHRQLDMARCRQHAGSWHVRPLRRLRRWLRSGW
jgi:hypothetical protein